MKKARWGAGLTSYDWSLGGLISTKEDWGNYFLRRALFLRRAPIFPVFFWPVCAAAAPVVRLRLRAGVLVFGIPCLAVAARESARMRII